MTSWSARYRAELERRNVIMVVALEQIINILGPSAPTCEGCAAEVSEALDEAKRGLRWRKP